MADITHATPPFNHDLAPFAAVQPLSRPSVAQMTRFGPPSKAWVNHPPSLKLRGTGPRPPPRPPPPSPIRRFADGAGGGAGESHGNAPPPAASSERPHQGQGIACAKTPSPPRGAGAGHLSLHFAGRGTQVQKGRGLGEEVDVPHGFMWPATRRRRLSVAERKGFEPSRSFHLYSLSRGAPSTTRPPLRRRGG